MPAVVLTPNIDGADGVSALTRLVVSALGPATAIITLNERGGGSGGVRIDCSGRRLRFVAASLAHAVRSDAATTAISVHLHLAPALLGFGLRGATTAAFLCGIEAWRPLTRAQAAALKRADALFAISAFTAARFREVSPAFASAPIAVCHPGIPPAPTPDARPEGARRVALIVARMASDERYKGHDVLIDVWPEVRAAVPDAVLRIVGDGDDRPRLEAKAASLTRIGAVEFAGRVPAGEIAREYANASAFVMPSTEEGFGLVFLEAMRAGRPCIGCRGAAAEIIDDGETGFVLTDQSPQPLVAAITRLLADPPAASGMGARGRRRFERQFTDDRFRSRLLAALPSAGVA